MKKPPTLPDMYLERAKNAADARKMVLDYLYLCKPSHAPRSAYVAELQKKLEAKTSFQQAHLKTVILGRNLPDPSDYDVIGRFGDERVILSHLSRRRDREPTPFELELLILMEGGKTLRVAYGIAIEAMQLLPQDHVFAGALGLRFPAQKTTPLPATSALLTA